MKKKIRLCPFCGGKPKIDPRNTIGSSIHLSCCIIDIDYQISDYITLEERQTWSPTTYKYSKPVRDKVYNLLLKHWNTRRRC